MSKQILIVGCGAIGGLFAAALSSAARVTALDTNADHVDAINARGIAEPPTVSARRQETSRGVVLRS